MEQARNELRQVFVDMQRAVVSLRDVAALLNQTCQKSQRQTARLFQLLGHQGVCFLQKKPSKGKKGGRYAWV